MKQLVGYVATQPKLMISLESSWISCGWHFAFPPPPPPPPKNKKGGGEETYWVKIEEGWAIITEFHTDDEILMRSQPKRLEAINTHAEKRRELKDKRQRTVESGFGNDWKTKSKLPKQGRNNQQSAKCHPRPFSPNIKRKFVCIIFISSNFLSFSPLWETYPSTFPPTLLNVVCPAQEYYILRWDPFDCRVSDFPVSTPRI